MCILTTTVFFPINYRSPFTFLATSLFWFSSVLIFRCISISILTLYVSHFSTNHCRTSVLCNRFPGTIAIPLTLIVTGNILLRLYNANSSKAAALLDGAMSAVAPVKFFIVDHKNHEITYMRTDGQCNILYYISI